MVTASPPMARMSSTVCWAGVASAPPPCWSPPRSLTTTLAPSLANSSACSRPSPRPAPVMMATRPSSAPIRPPSRRDPRRTGRRTLDRPVGNLGAEEEGPLGALVDAGVARRRLGPHQPSRQVALGVDLEALGLEQRLRGVEREPHEVGDRHHL